MALSYTTYTGNGAQTDYTLSFPYFDPADIGVFVNSVSVPFTFINSSAVRLDTAPAADTAIRIRRLTNKGAVPVDFTDGSNLLEKDLDVLAAWMLYQAQEATDVTTDLGLIAGQPLETSIAAAVQANASAGQAAISAAAAAAALSGLTGVAGAGLVGFLQAGTGAIPRSVDAKLKDFSRHVKDFGAVGNGSTNDDTALAVAVACAKVGGFSLDLGDQDCLYAVTTPLVIDGANSMNLYSQGAAILGPVSGSLAALLDVKNCTDFNIHGRLGLVGRYNTGLGCGIWVHADVGSGCSLVKLDSLAFSGCTLAYRFGDTAYPDKVISEISVYGGYTYGCPEVVRAEGTQTIVTFHGSILASDSFGGNAGWAARTQTTLRSLGAYIRQDGGELLHASNASGAAVDVQPIVSAAYGNPYGSYVGTNVMVESAAQLGTASNPGVIATPAGGRLQFVACGGYHAANSFAFIQTDAGFSTGQVHVSGCDFYGGTARTQPNIQCAANGTHVYCDEASFGNNFLGQLHGISGGTPHFDSRLILVAASPPAQVVTGGVLTTIKYAAATTGGDYTRYAPAYDASTGIFTVPAGGLKDVQIRAGFNPGAAVATDVFIIINGAYGNDAVSLSAAGGITGFIKSLAAGDTVRIQCQAASGITLSGAFNYLKIVARN